MFYSTCSFKKKLMNKRSSSSGTSFLILVSLCIFVIQSTLPQFGTIHHQHDGGEQAHFHPEAQSFLPEAYHHDASDHHHEDSTSILQIDQSDSNNVSVLAQLRSFDQGHTHTYDHFIGKFFVGTIQSHFYLPFQPIDSYIDQTWFPDYELYVNPRAPPLLI